MYLCAIFIVVFTASCQFDSIAGAPKNVVDIVESLNHVAHDDVIAHDHDARQGPVSFQLVDDSIIGSQKVYCRPGYTLLSCGIGNLAGTRPELYRSTVPESATSCQCYDYFGAKCMTWCSTAVRPDQFHIASTRVQRGEFDVSCPSGYKVLGCSLSPANNGNGNFEKYRQYYPTLDGNGCVCYDYFGGKCYATCASNIARHEVRSAYGTGVVTVECSPGYVVLGCGVKTVNTDTGRYESFKAFHVQQNSQNRCQCYDYYGTTCYASCGQFA